MISLTIFSSPMWLIAIVGYGLKYATSAKQSAARRYGQRIFTALPPEHSEHELGYQCQASQREQTSGEILYRGLAAQVEEFKAKAEEFSGAGHCAAAINQTLPFLLNSAAAFSIAYRSCQYAIPPVPLRPSQKPSRQLVSPTLSG